MEDDTDSSGMKRWIVTVQMGGVLNEEVDSVGVKAPDEEAALAEVSDYEVYEVRVRHENGGTEYQEVFAESEEAARRKAVERDLSYSTVLDVEVWDDEFDLGAELEFPETAEDDSYDDAIEWTVRGPDEHEDGEEFPGPPEDPAPTVYDEDGNPMKVRLVAHEAVGEVSGEGHYGYTHKKSGDHATVWFEATDLEDGVTQDTEADQRGGSS